LTAFLCVVMNALENRVINAEELKNLEIEVHCTK
jgi:hypothetical protein